MEQSTLQGWPRGLGSKMQGVEHWELLSAHSEDLTQISSKLLRIELRKYPFKDKKGIIKRRPITRGLITLCFKHWVTFILFLRNYSKRAIL